MSHVCRYCQKTYVRQIELIKHTHIKHKDIHICNKCEMVFRNKSTFMKHVGVCHLPATDYLCILCGRIFVSKYYFQNHLTTDHTNVKHICFNCQMTFKSELDLDNHECRICEICKATFRMKFDHLRHKCFCFDCKITCKSKVEFVNHKCISSSDTKVICEICKVNFKSKVECENHKCIGPSDTKHICEICKVTFKSKVVFESHKCNICEICKVTFRTKFALLKHICFCLDCKFTFKSKVDFKNHKCNNSSDTEEKLDLKHKFSERSYFYCEFCNHRSVSKSILFHHMTNKHGYSYRKDGKIYFRRSDTQCKVAAINAQLYQMNDRCADQKNILHELEPVAVRPVVKTYIKKIKTEALEKNIPVKFSTELPSTDSIKSEPHSTTSFTSPNILKKCSPSSTLTLKSDKSAVDENLFKEFVKVKSEPYENMDISEDGLQESSDFLYVEVKPKLENNVLLINEVKCEFE